MNYSLLRYPGGKTRAIKTLKNFIPFGTTEICSPFFGGGSFEIYLSTIGIKIVHKNIEKYSYYYFVSFTVALFERSNKTLYGLTTKSSTRFEVCFKKTSLRDT